MVGKLLAKGMFAGLLAGLLVFAFLTVFGEPSLDRAIAFEAQASAAAAISHGAQASPAKPEPELVSRQTQAGLGLLTGVLVYGAAVGGLFAIAFAFANGRLGTLGPRATTVLLAAVGLISMVLVPALKYPPNPPGVGSGDTIDPRTQLFFAMMAVSVLGALASVLTARRFWTSLGGWRACFLAGGAYALTVALAATALPSLHEVPNEFPAGVLWDFRAASFSGHILFWVLLAAAFATFQTAPRSRSPRRYSAA